MPPLHHPSVRLVVWRHGQTDHNASGIWQGHLDTSLSETGLAQARAAAPTLAGRRPAVVVSSDLARAAQTADVLGELLGADVQRDERLREIHVGGWQGKTAAQVRAEYPVDAERLLTGEDFRRGGDGETVAEVAQRVRACADDVIARLPHGGLGVVVTHGVSGRALAAGLAGLDQQLAWRVLGSLLNCHWAELALMPSGGWRIDQWNVSSALASTEAAPA